jgi:class 3 adenylate cyclase
LRYAVVQIIDDDKGVHLVAAVNLYESIPETSLKGIEVCSDLTKQQVGCAIGMASGPTYCGVTGCFSVACRWDITGATAVRAARLMQYALASEITVAIDQSVYDCPVAAARMTLLDAEVELKRTHYCVPVYTISDSAKLSAFRVLETVHGTMIDSPRDTVL